jgi:hypothetical protein
MNKKGHFWRIWQLTSAWMMTTMKIEKRQMKQTADDCDGRDASDA